MNKTFFLSKYVNFVKFENKYILFHSLFGNPLLITKKEYTDILSKKTSDALSKELINNCFYIKSDNIEENILNNIYKKKITELKKGTYFDCLTINLTSRCNFSCTHCLPIKEKEIHNTANSIDTLTTEKIKQRIDDFFNFSKSKKRKQFFFGGREPLIKKRLLKETINYINKKALEYNVNIQYIMFTNASLIDNKIAQFLKANNFLIFSSIEGPENINNLQRIFPNKSGTYEKITNGWKILKEEKIPLIAASITLTPSNYKKAINKDFLIELKNFDIKRLAINVDHTAHWNRQQTNKLIKNIISYDNLTREIDIKLTGQWKDVFTNLFSTPSNSLRTSFCESHSGFCLNITSDNLLSFCPANNEKLHITSSINELVESEEYLSTIQSRWIHNIKECNGCPIEGFCSGGCTVTNTVIKNSKRFKERCYFLKSLFEYQLKKYVNELNEE